MWKLTSPSIDSVEQDLRDALTYVIDKPAIYPISQPEINLVKALYLDYDASYGRPKEQLKGENLSDTLRNALRDAYSQVQETGRLKLLRDRLKLAPAHCPLCGFGPIQDLDHHLPKSIYKPLAIYPRNLIPSCTTCNKKKYTVAETEPTKQFLHTYLEALPNEIFFIADVALDPAPGGLRVNYRIEQSAAMSIELAERLRFQIDRLGLNDRYKKEINTYLSSLEVALKDAYGLDKSADRIRLFLLKSADSSEIRFGRNDWRTALLRGLAVCNDFCNGGFVRALGSPTPGA